MKRFTLVVFNTLTLIAVLILNGMAGSGSLTGTSVGEVSRKFDTLFTPAGYAFSIWGLIYIGLIAFTVFQWVAVIRKSNLEIIDHTGGWFIAANLANISWLFLWLNESVGLSVLAMFVLLISLISLMFRLKLETWDAPVRIIAFVWWPWAIYLGWIVVATVANVAAFLTFLGWGGGPLDPATWTMLVIAIAVAIYLLLIVARNLRESAAVGVWALIAIVMRQQEAHPSIAVVAGIAAVVLLFAMAIQGFRRRKTNPFYKLLRGSDS